MTLKIYNVVFSIIFARSLYISHACSMEGVSNWLLPVTQNILDTNRGIFFRRTTSNIAAINTVTNSEGLNAGPYISVSYNESEFTIGTNEQYENYEENETVESMGVTVVFRCTGGTLSTLVFSINVIDTNNNAPKFKPSDNYHFKIAPPVPPGFLITDCVNDIIARDIDLTTERIDFRIEENPYFEITNDASTSPKEFKAILRTTTFIRRISEPISLWISATDVDRTGDPPLTTNATVRIESDNEFEFPDDLIFSEAFYIATYTEKNEVILEKTIYLQQGYDENVTFDLEGDYREHFELIVDGNKVTLKVKSQLPSEILRQTLIYFVIRAKREYTSGSTTAVILKLRQEISLHFDMDFYEGSIVDNSLEISNLILLGDYNNVDTSVTIYGEFSRFFTANVETNIITLKMDPLDDNIIKENNILTLQVAATINNNTATTIVVLEVVKEDYVTPIFEKNIYNATYDPVAGVTVEDILLIQGYDDTITVSLTGDYENYFQIIQDGAVLIINSSSLPSQVISEKHLLLNIKATKPRTVGAHTVIYIVMPKETDDKNAFFDKLHYKGILRGYDVSHETIIISSYNGTTMDIEGDQSDLFIAQINSGEVIVQLKDSSTVPVNASHVILELHVTGASAVLVLQVIKSDSEVSDVSFDKLHYKGDLRGLVVTHETIFVTGYQGTNIDIFGDHADLFIGQINSGEVTVLLKDSSTLPVNTSHVILELHVVDAGAVLILNVIESDSEVNNVFFDKLYYKGNLRGSDVFHETIVVFGYNGTNIDILGDSADLFIAQLQSGEISVQLRDSTILPMNTPYVVLELHVSDARSVLILEITESEVPVLPTVRFSSESYIIQVEISQTGLVGQVTASADNGEAVFYSLILESVHLQERMSINDKGELHLSAPANSGSYIFQVVATSIFTRVNGTAKVFLTAEDATTCSNDIVVPPLIVIDRDEEAPHENLIELNTTAFRDCHYEMKNRWPVNQTWLYVDESGLHTRAIDREHASIAFMALSQIQVELILHCKSDEQTPRIKRSIIADAKPNPLGPYDYGSRKWVLTETILYNGRRSFVNLIVNDINDNDPVFILKDNEPIAVGYPLPELEEYILPKALVELKATDADIGENAALVYWSPEPVLAVSPSTGYVHVRKNAHLVNGDLLKVYATDRNGRGRTGSIDLVVRLLEINRIAVIRIQGAFLEDVNNILSELSNTLGYEVKSLMSTVIPENSNTEKNKEIQIKKKQITESSGSLLQLYIYGLIDREPVEVNQLTADINNSILTVNVASSISLEDHLESREICSIPERDTGLLAATIALSILLFVLIMALALWFSLKWRMKQNYDKFSDENSLASRNHSLQLPKTDGSAKPRVNLEERRKSERRLQEVLDAPVKMIEIDPESKNEVPPSPELRMPIIIQSIDKLKDAIEASDDEDEFGESEKIPRKSVVTFNENVEKIIHLVDNQNDPDCEVYRF